MKALEKSKASIKADGLSHIKFELEAQLNRQYHRVTWLCTDCNGVRVPQCAPCNGTGAVQVRGVHMECSRCQGNGGAACLTCEGRGSQGSFGDLPVCQTYILDYLSRKIYGMSLKERLATGTELGPMDYRGGQGGGTAFPFINYLKFYVDGSVDSELTITIPIEVAEYSKDILEAFISMAKLASKDKIDVKGAGMHIAVLPEGCNGTYPSDVRLNALGLRNFTTEVTKLLPALYFVATAGHRSRSMQYRSPRISNDSKYSAIYTLGGRVFEFRVFETCYDRPEAVYEFIQVIANALKFYGDPSRKVKTLGKNFGFPNSTAIANYYSTTEQLRILNATVKYLKPEDKPFKQMKVERGVKYTIKSLAVKEKSRLSTLRAEYQEYKRHYDYVKGRPLSSREQSSIDWLMSDNNFTLDAATQHVLDSRIGHLVPFSEFLARNLTKQKFNQTVSV